MDENKQKYLLSVKAPHLLKEWDFENNKNDVSEVSVKSKAKAAWRCEHGHLYKKSIYARVHENPNHINCEQCKEEAWNKDRNLIEHAQADDKTDYWWKCKEGHEFIGKINELMCPRCVREKKIKEYQKIVPDILNKLTLTPYEQYLCKLLSNYNISTYGNNKYRDVRIFKTKRFENTVTNIGITLKNNGFFEIKRETYIDPSIFDDFICRRQPFGHDFNEMRYLYPEIFISLIESTKYLEGKEGVIDLSKEFKEELLIFCIENCWRSWFCNSINHAELQRSSNKYFVENEDYWNWNMSHYSDLKTRLALSDSFEDRLKLCNDIVEDEHFQIYLFPYGYPGYESGLDMLLGNYPSSKIQQKIDNALYNFDANMKRMSETDSNEFNTYLDKYIAKNSFMKVEDLNTCTNKSGIYMMVLDKYKRVYIGQATDICGRIKMHWNKAKNKPLGRLVFGDIENSNISIDCFGPLDTTRVYIKECEKALLDELESKYVAKYDSKYTINRIPGGVKVPF